MFHTITFIIIFICFISFSRPVPNYPPIILNQSNYVVLFNVGLFKLSKTLDQMIYDLVLGSSIPFIIIILHFQYTVISFGLFCFLKFVSMMSRYHLSSTKYSSRPQQAHKIPYHHVYQLPISLTLSYAISIQPSQYVKQQLYYLSTLLYTLTNYLYLFSITVVCKMVIFLHFYYCLYGVYCLDISGLFIRFYCGDIFGFIGIVICCLFIILLYFLYFQFTIYLQPTYQPQTLSILFIYSPSPIQQYSNITHSKPKTTNFPSIYSYFQFLIFSQQFYICQFQMYLEQCIFVSANLSFMKYQLYFVGRYKFFIHSRRWKIIVMTSIHQMLYFLHLGLLGWEVHVKQMLVFGVNVFVIVGVRVSFCL